MFPLPFWGVFIRSTAVTRAPADSPQLFKEIWMPGLKQGRAQEKRGRQKEGRRRKKEEKKKKGKKSQARAAGRDASTSRGMARAEWRTGWIRRESEAGTEGGGQESNKLRVPSKLDFLHFTLDSARKKKKWRPHSKATVRSVRLKESGLQMPWFEKKGWRDGKIKQQQRTVMHH